MNYKFNKYFLALAFASTLTLVSCGDDFLTKAPQGALDADALANAQGVELLTTSAYAALSTPVEGKDPYQASPFNWVWGSVYGGDANKGSDPGDQSTVNEIELYNTLATNGYLDQKWAWVYMTSNRVNRALQTVAVAEDIDEATATRRTAELKFIRALAYFEGMRVFGRTSCPYIDETHTENNPMVSNGVDISDKVLADVDAAIAGLPETVTDTDPGEVGRVTYWAAQALKAKILMYLNRESEAKPILADLLTNGVTSQGAALGLEDHIYDNFNALTENGKESIFSIQYSAADENNAQACLTLCYPHNSGPGGCCGFFQPSYELANSFKVDENGLPYLNNEYRQTPSVSTRNEDPEGILALNSDAAVDPRLDIAVGRYGVPYKDWGEPANDWVRNPVNGGIFLPKKFVLSKAEEDAGMYRMYGGWAPGSAMNIQYLNVRDMKLLYAECLAEDGQLAEAMAQVNDIRRRAGLETNITTKADGTPAANYKISEYPSSHAAFSDKETCIKAIRMERKLELAMEGERWFDLVRWGGDYMAQTLRDYIDYEKQYITKFAGASYLPASKTMLPVPDNEILTMGTNPETGEPYLVQPEPWR